MFINITNTPYVIENERSMLALMEYIYGQRFKITVNKSGVNLSQDKDFNMNEFGSLLDLEKLWKALLEVYRLDQNLLMNAPFRDYVLHCIYYDPDLTKDKDHKYHAKGIIITTIETQGQIVRDDKMEEFGQFIKLPVNKPIMISGPEEIKSNFPRLKTQSNYSLDNIPYGFVFRNCPTESYRDTTTGQIDTKQWIYYNTNIATDDIAKHNEDPLTMAKEYVFVSLKDNVVKDLEEETKVNPMTQKVAYKNMLWNTLRDYYGMDGDRYFERCKFKLEGKSDKVKRDNFDKLVKKQIRSYLDDYVLQQPRFRKLKGTKK